MKKNIQQQQYIVSHLNEYGPIIEAEIYTNEHIFLYKKNHNKPVHFKTVQLLIDTGASISGLDNSIIKSLQLPEYSELAQVEGAGGIV
jgi:predicted aspartyl protease